ncbi:DUF4388 domain-containing protein [bacterium]|nr:DUF4388 domain-containing protein [bacterium]
MQGNLESTNLAEILLDLFLAKKSGILRLSRNEVKKSVYFLDGAVVFAHSNQKHDRLGETLLRLGKIAQEEFDLASREVIEKGKRLGQALSELGFISAQEVNSSVHYQLQQILYSLFDWDSGEYEFVERERPVFEDIMIDVSTPSLIVEGIRNISNPVVLERGYQKNEEQVLFLNNGVPRLTRTDFDFQEETILACVDGNKTIAAVRQLARLSGIEFDRALFSLVLCGTLQFQEQDRPSLAPEQQPEMADQTRAQSFTTQRMEESSGPESERMKTLSEDELRQLVLLTRTRFQEATDEEVLHVLPDCTLQEVNEAYESLRSQFHAPYHSPDRFLELKEPLKAILDRITQAHGNLVAKVASQMPLSETPLESLVAPLPPVPLSPKDSMPQRSESEKPLVTPAGEEQKVRIQPEKESISELQEQLQREPGNTMLLRKLGKRFYETGKPQEGEKHFLKALELEPQSVENHFALVEFYQSMGLNIKAFKHLNIILQLQPNNERAMEMLHLKKSKKPLYEIEH